MRTADAHIRSRLIPVVLVFGPLIVACGPGTVQRADDVARFISAPRNADEFIAIYPEVKQVSGGRLRTANATLDDYLRTGGRVLSPTATNPIATGLRAQAAATTTPYFSLIGHNNAGTMQFADGSSMAIATLVDSLPAGTTAVVISCKSALYLGEGSNAVGPFQVIDYRLAQAIESRFLASLPTDGSKPTVEDLQNLMNSAVNGVARERNLKIVASVATVTGITGTGLTLIANAE
jgi:hypothetical protein